MLLGRQADDIIAITQPAHAWLSGVLARAWGKTAFAPPELHEAFCLAAGLHDIGWLARDVSPKFDAATGLPQEFWDVPAVEHTELWSNGVRSLEVLSAYAAILISMHGDTIYDKTFDPATARPENAEAVRVFRAEQSAFRAVSIARLRQNPTFAAQLSEVALERNKLLLAAIDTLSLNICWGITKPVTLVDVPSKTQETTGLVLRPRDDGIAIDPWPFKPASLTVCVEGRRLRPCNTADELAVAWRDAPPTTIVTHLYPA